MCFLSIWPRQRIIAAQMFHAPLEKAGLVPPHCKVLKLQVGVSGALTITYEVFLDAGQLVTLGEIFQTVGQRVIDDDERAARARGKE